MNRWLLFLVPDKQATLLAGVLSGVAFLLGLVDMMSRDFMAASLHLHLSVGIMAFLFVLRYVSLRATYRVAEHAQTQLRRHIRNIRRSPLPMDRTDAERQAQEKAEMAELTAQLRHALEHIEADSPVRPKYEATLELMERIGRKA